MEFSTHSPEETLELGRRLGQKLIPGDCVLLFGELGAGKTTFTLGLARGLGLPENEYVRSPTFTLINQYQGRLPIYHLDLYRLETVADMEQLGLDDMFSSEGVFIIEWAEKLFQTNSSGKLFPLFGIDSRLEIKLVYQEENTRTIEIKAIDLDPATHPVFSLQ